MNQSLPYMVFVTADGDNHGLYIATRTPSGFVVRENQNGHSTLAFDYRIVAHPYGAVHPRLPHFASMGLQRPAMPLQVTRPATAGTSVAARGGYIPSSASAPNATTPRSTAAVRTAHRQRVAQPAVHTLLPAAFR